MHAWKFYHYCSEKNLADARKHGIAAGVLPLQVNPDPKNLKQNTFRYMKLIQWLTKNPEFIAMDADHGPPRTALLGGRKAEYRISVMIPPGFRDNVRPWSVLAEAMRDKPDRRGMIPLDPRIEREINIDLGNPAEWWCFGGIIPPTCISEFTRNPSIPSDPVIIKT